MPTPKQYPVARHSAGFAPPRRPGSVRRTTSIDSDWPEGLGRAWIMVGRGRDIITPTDGAAVEVRTGGFRLRVSPEREILSIELTPGHPNAQQLVGARAGSASRRALASALNDLRGGPTYQLIDDFAGASLVAPWVWSQWSGMMTDGRKGALRRMTNICAGFAEGATSLEPDGGPRIDVQSSAVVGPLENPEDPDGWHAMPKQRGPQARRARRVDVWREDGIIKVDAGFQDSGPNRDGGRTAVHEYRVSAEVDAHSGVLAAVRAEPLILPYRECPGASRQVERLVGQHVEAFRESVPEILASTLGCTHLNDVLRGLADVPSLARLLPAE